ncbi:FAD-dependent thymidylate synthase [archaeon]|jgi:flavin-dependent thymidylate synthase|nr:FAD-dependent thymidylate synthase [archaeon]MBT3451218.1 FAD-dependent thymidylate synthase [archaeon]MBT6869784.1 FAD-dependent thymidylate synthase [archaeon]MBT7192739.1 FAD-dependent thymidylate synthase [archaeon]MBT7380764.1 FAD-dependent thymidylate synthase [archaeon]
MLDIFLAAHTVDVGTLKKLQDGTFDPTKDEITPEVFSAAAARISRDPRTIKELVDEASEQVKKARKSNRTIVYAMNHHSIAEHATFGYGIMGLSRLGVEKLEHHRLCSFTEKSQRYITLDGDFIIPKEFDSGQRELFLNNVTRQNEFYFKVLPELIEYQKSQNPELVEQAKEAKARGVSDKMNRAMNTIEGWAKEDARYALTMATEVQLAFAANARNLEYAIRGFKYEDLEEIQELGRLLYEPAAKIAPSLIIMADDDRFEKFKGIELDNSQFENGVENIQNAIGNYFMGWGNFIKRLNDSIGDTNDVILLDSDDCDKKLISTLLVHRNVPITFEMADRVYGIMADDDKKKFIREVLKDTGRFDALPREAEFGDYEFQLNISASCYAQLKRHRMTTQIAKDYDPHLGITVPESIKQIGKDQELKDICNMGSSSYFKISDGLRDQGKGFSSAQYVLTNAHRRLVKMKINDREMCAFSRLRCDLHAQWDIRNIANQMVKIAKEVNPLTAAFYGGKHEFDQIRKQFYSDEK